MADNIATNQHLCALLVLTRAATKRLAADLADAADRLDAEAQAADA